MDLVTIDFEASCLPRHGRSYPIEVGVADGGGRMRAWLIRPHPAWDGWDWTQEAEQLHGISRARILQCGLPAARVMDELADVLKGCRVVADSHIDHYWLETLAAAAGAPWPGRIEHVENIIAELGSGPDEIRAALALLEARGFRRHRAGDDAAWLYAFIAALEAMGAERIAARASVAA